MFATLHEDGVIPNSRCHLTPAGEYRSNPCNRRIIADFAGPLRTRIVIWERDERGPIAMFPSRRADCDGAKLCGTDQLFDAMLNGRPFEPAD